MHQASTAVLHAGQLGDTSSTIEHARLTWLKGYHRKAIQSLRGTIEARAFEAGDPMMVDGNARQEPQSNSQRENMTAARAQLLLAKWIDRAGQTKSVDIVEHYKQVTAMQARWEKGHYHLGKHYNKLLESERSNPLQKQAKSYLDGEMAKLTIENLLRSLAFGSKYIHQALPKVLTLWLDFGAVVGTPVENGISPALDPVSLTHQRKKVFGVVMANLKKYIDRLPAYMFYTAFAQIVARIDHNNNVVFQSLTDIIAKVVGTHPQQAMWPLLAMMNSKITSDRISRAAVCKNKILEFAKKSGSETNRVGMLKMLKEGIALSKQLLLVCNHSFESNQAPRGALSLSRDMNFNHGTATPCQLVIPIEAALLATLPTVTTTERSRKTQSPSTSSSMSSSCSTRSFVHAGSRSAVRTAGCTPSCANLRTTCAKTNGSWSSTL
jgi:serine/threonine-protein kinase ATR